MQDRTAARRLSSWASSAGLESFGDLFPVMIEMEEDIFFDWMVNADFNEEQLIQSLKSNNRIRGKIVHQKDG